jgi:hypothetical protein
MRMTRREAMRVAGGGVLLAVSPACARWSAGDEATAAWREAGAGADPRLRALSFALLAPSPHNLQPWIADVRRPDEIVLAVDTARLLPETDPPGRQVTIGQGTFLELLELALRAQGLAPHLALFPEGEYAAVPDGRPVARLTLAPAPPARDPLLAEVPRRHTNRAPFAPRPVGASDLDALLATDLPAEVRAAGAVEPARRDRIAELAYRGFEVEVTTARTFGETVRLLRVGASEIEAHRDGIAVTGFTPWLARRLGLLDERALLDPKGRGVRQALADARRQVDTAQGWVWLSTAGNSRREQVLAGRAYVRLHLAATRLGLAWQPMSQLLQEFPEMAALQAQAYAALGVPPAGATVQMLARIGHAAPASPSPRRPLGAIVRS